MRLGTHTPTIETEDKKREENEGDTNQTAELCDADTVESSLPPDSRQKRLADLQAERAACDPTHLQGLKVIMQFDNARNKLPRIWTYISLCFRSAVKGSCIPA